MGDRLIESFLRQGQEFQVLFNQLATRSGVHAYLIVGEKGTGKRTLARLMARTLLCSAEDGRPCGKCRNCVMAENNEHPDIIVIEQGNPIASGIRKDRTTIPVEDIREMIRLCGVRSPEGNMHVVLIFDAEKMTPQAQNCLLKTLEEPPADTCMILAAEHSESLLTTVKSRCRTIRMKAWDDRYILQVLTEKGIPGARAKDAVSAGNGSIGKALELASDEGYWKLRKEVMDCFFALPSRSEILKISNQWKDRKADAEQILGILDSYVCTLAEARYREEGQKDLSAFPENWQRFSETAEAERFTALTDTISEARKQLKFSTNFQAVLERMIFTFMKEGNA